MSIFKNIVNRDDIIRKYFSNDEKKIELKKGDVLLNQHQLNEKLFYIHKGKLNGYLPDIYSGEPVFEASVGSFVGVYSFFSDEHGSYSKVIAQEPSIVFYFDEDPSKLEGEDAQFFQQFLFNIAIAELKQRQGFAAQRLAVPARNRRTAVLLEGKTKAAVSCGLRKGLKYGLCLFGIKHFNG